MNEEADAESRCAKSDFAVSSSIIYSIAARGKQVSKRVTPVEARTITGTSDIKYGPREKAKPRSRTCGWLLPLSPRPLRLAKQGLPVLRGRARASRLIVWKMAYCLHLPTTCTPWPTTLYMRPSILSLSNDPWDSFVTYYAKDINRLSIRCFFLVRVKGPKKMDKII